MTETFDFFIFYSQISVFDPDLEEPGNDWRDVQVAQGFAWRASNVSFGTLIDVGRLPVEVRQADLIELCPEAVRAIVVPFVVPPSGKVGLSDVVHDGTATLPPSSYALVFETAFLTDNPEDGTWVRLTFVPDESATPAILRADDGLNPPEILDMHAEPV